jgi:hypothetical protein
LRLNRSTTRTTAVKQFASWQHSSKGKNKSFCFVMENANQSRVRVTALVGWAVKGRATDSSPVSSLSGPIRHRAQSGSQRVRIEARDESVTQEKATATAKETAKTTATATAKTKTPLRKKQMQMQKQRQKP